jgi:Arc/MetJ-type ribon-helix-helix transcriptional regulator
MPILPPKDDRQRTVGFSITLPRWQQDRLDALAHERGYRSRSEVIARLLEWAFQELEREAREAQRFSTYVDVHKTPIPTRTEGVHHIHPPGTIGAVLPTPTGEENTTETGTRRTARPENVPDPEKEQRKKDIRKAHTKELVRKTAKKTKSGAADEDDHELSDHLHRSR